MSKPDLEMRVTVDRFTNNNGIVSLAYRFSSTQHTPTPISEWKFRQKIIEHLRRGKLD